MRFMLLLWAVWLAGSAVADELTLATATRPAANDVDEPIAEFSLDRGVAFLDRAALDWTARRKCFTCHTNYAYLLARPMIGADVAAHRQVRAKLEELVETRWSDQGPRWDAEVVMTAAVLAINDSLTTDALAPATKMALDRMWTLQRDDGGFDWLKCGWPPMEIDDDYGIAIAAIATGAAPDDYAETAAAQNGLQNLRNYLHNNPPPTLHHRAMLLWADGYGVEMLSSAQRVQTMAELHELQKEDGGWSAATLADWQRSDGSPQDLEHSDAYGTAFVTFILQQAGVESSDPAVAGGIGWLKQNQRASGRWFARSLYRDSKHFLSHAASCFAVMAIAAADQP